MLYPIQDKIILKVKNDEEITKSGIILSSNSSQKSLVAKVVSVGIDSDEMEIKEEDTVFVEKGIGIEINYEGESYLVVEKSNILAIIR